MSIDYPAVLKDLLLKGVAGKKRPTDLGVGGREGEKLQLLICYPWRM